MCFSRLPAWVGHCRTEAVPKNVQGAWSARRGRAVHHRHGGVDGGDQQAWCVAAGMGGGPANLWPCVLVRNRLRSRPYDSCVIADSVIDSDTGYTYGGINIVGNIHSGFPTPTFPPLKNAGSVILTATFIMFIGFVESIAVAKTYSQVYRSVGDLDV